MEAVSLTRLSHPHLCKVLGFTGEDPVMPPDKRTGFERERLLVYEHTFNGSLDSLLYCRSGKPPLDWVTRVKVAMGAAKGLAYLHERIPRQVDFSHSFRCMWAVSISLCLFSLLADMVGFSGHLQKL